MILGLLYVLHFQTSCLYFQFSCVCGRPECKAAKCGLVIASIKLDAVAALAIVDLLPNQVSEFAECVMCTSGRCLCWYLGINSIEETLKA